MNWQVWQNLHWAEMTGPLIFVVILFILAVALKVMRMNQDPLYRDEILYRKDKNKR
jgi:hypothetical protein